MISFGVGEAAGAFKNTSWGVLLLFYYQQVVGIEAALVGLAIAISVILDAVSDPLNGLVVSAGLHWREVDVLRGLAGYAFQVGGVPSRSALPSALTKSPGIAR